MAHTSSNFTATKSSTRRSPSMVSQTKKHTKSEYPEAGSDDVYHRRLDLAGAAVGSRDTEHLTDQVTGLHSITWYDSKFDRLDITVNNEVAITTNKRVRLLHRTDSHSNQGVPSSNAGKYVVSFLIVQEALSTSNLDLNTKAYTDRTPETTDYGIYLSSKDDDANDESPEYLNKTFDRVYTGYNSIEVNCFDDGDTLMPTIDLVIHRDAKLKLIIDNIRLYYLGAPS